MDFHLATPTGDVLLFSSADGRTVQFPAAVATAAIGAESSAIVPGHPTLSPT